MTIKLDELSGLFAKETEKLGHEEDESAQSARNRLESLVSELVEIDSRLSSLNFFVAEGVAASAKSTETFLALVQQRASALRETRMPGYHTVSEYLRRFDGSARNMIRIADKYELTRRRVTELLSIARSEMERLRSNDTEQTNSSLQRLTKRLTSQTDQLRALAVIAALAASLSVYRDEFSTLVGAYFAAPIAELQGISQWAQWAVWLLVGATGSILVIVAFRLLATAVSMVNKCIDRIGRIFSGK